MSVTIFQEYDYYDEIVEFYEQTQCNGSVTKRDIDIWQSKLIINLMKEMKENSQVTTDVNMDIVKKIMILILSLFKENENSCVELKELAVNKKKEVIESLSYFL